MNLLDKSHIRASMYLSIFTTRKRLFAVCLNFCRVLFFGHTAKALFAVCIVENTRQIKHTRQTAIFAVCRPKAHGKQPFSPCAEAPAHGEAVSRTWHVLLPSGPVARADGRECSPCTWCSRVPARGTRLRRDFAVC